MHNELETTYYISSGFSMLPSIPSDSVLHIRKCNLDIGIGDVCFGLINDKLIVHRVVDIKKNIPNEYLLKGDNNSSHDGWIEKKDVIGTVSRASRYDHSVNFRIQQKTVTKIILRLYCFFGSMSGWEARLLVKLFGRLLYICTKDHKYQLHIFQIIIKSHVLNPQEKEFYEYLFNEKKRERPSRAFIDWCLLNKISPTHIGKILSSLPEAMKVSRSITLKNISSILLRKKISLYANTITDTFKQHGISYFPLKKQLYEVEEIEWGADIDLLIKKNQWDRAISVLEAIGCVKKNVPPQGLTLVSPNDIEVDLHWVVAIPRIHQVNKLQVSRLTKQIWKVEKKTREVNEMLLLATIVNFWNNDFAKGFGVYKKIYEWLYLSNSRLKLKSVLKYAESFSVKWIVILIIARSELLYQHKLSKEIEQLVTNNWRLRLVLMVTTFGQVMQKDSRKMWWYDASYEAWPFTLEAHFIQLIIDPAVPLVRLLRPRIVIYLLIIVVSAFIRRSDLLWKNY